MLRGERVVLRTPESADVDALEAMFLTREVSPWWHSYDRARVQAEIIDGDEPQETVYVIDVDGEVAGIIQSYEEPEPDYREAGLDIAVAPRWHGQGIALDAIRTLARHLIDDRGHHRLTIDPALANERAIAAYTKVGFKPVGVMRQYERGADGTWHDSLLMDMLADELI